ncbi:CHAT domain-containing protein [Actinokineospora cianjurensis]|uniref:CHAT domain-containing protein n=1 Tax=Actinokineospora cianjurensis TaxID=585224 RepID=UPI000EB498B2|nr:CHAT domain-containing protein [Actinokineospora cianjurensis]
MVVGRTPQREGLRLVAPDDPRRAGIAFNLGSRTGDADLLAEAATQDIAPPDVRLNAALWWADTATDLAAKVAAHRIAVDMLARLAWRGRDRDHQQAQIMTRPGVACDAAALEVAAGSAERAIEVLERGRALLWGQLLHLRANLTRLAESAPTIAEGLDRLRGRLDDPIGEVPRPGMRLRLLDAWADLLAQARAMPEFEGFLAPAVFDDLDLGVPGPVVVINVSRFGCAALIVTPGPAVRVLPLAVTAVEVAARARRLRVLVSDRRRTALERETERRELLDVLEWLWTEIAEPVLADLGHRGVPEGEPPRIWWCPTGPLTALPLHAAGRHSRTNTQPTDLAQTVAGRVVSSYTPTLAALTGLEPASGDCLLVGVGAAPGRSPLPAVPAELALLGARLPSATTLSEAAATTDAVRRALLEHSWVHLACHAQQDEHDAVASGVELWDRRLTVAELMGTRTAGAFAYLSACETATGAIDLADEALHLAGTLQVVGYRQVVATLWSVRDAVAAEVSDVVYGGLVPGEPRPAAARALHAAVEGVRSRHPADPLLWAPFLHTGI